MAHHVNKSTYAKVKKERDSLEAEKAGLVSSVEYWKNQHAQSQEARQKLQGHLDDQRHATKNAEREKEVVIGELIEIKNRMVDYGLEAAPGELNQDVSVERRFGRAEAEIRALILKNPARNSYGMAMGEVSHRNRRPARY